MSRGYSGNGNKKCDVDDRLCIRVSICGLIIILVLSRPLSPSLTIAVLSLRTSRCLQPHRFLAACAAIRYFLSLADHVLCSSEGSASDKTGAHASMGVHVQLRTIVCITERGAR